MLACHPSFSNLDTDGDVAIPFNNMSGFLRPGIQEVSEFLRKGRMESQARDVEESEDTQGSLVNGVLAEVGEIDESSSSGVNDGGDSLVEGNVGVNAVDASLKPMTVEVHQPWTNVLSLKIQNVGTCPGIEIGLETQNPAVFDSHV